MIMLVVRNAAVMSEAPPTTAPTSGRGSKSFVDAVFNEARTTQHHHRTQRITSLNYSDILRASKHLSDPRYNTEPIRELLLRLRASGAPQPRESMSLFTPFELVHAHLPAAAAASYDIRQVTVPSDRAFPETEDEWESPLHQEHAVSAAFDPRTAIVARSVCNGYVLELRSISPAVTKGHPADPSIIRILLPDRLRPLIGGCVVPSLRAGRLVVVAVTEADVVYRFSFPLSSFVDKGSRCTFDVKDDDDWAEEWTVDEDMISSAGGVGSWAVTNEDTVVLGCADGGIIKVARSPQSTPGELL